MEPKIDTIEAGFIEIETYLDEIVARCNAIIEDRWAINTQKHLADLLRCYAQRCLGIMSDAGRGK